VAVEVVVMFFGDFGLRAAPQGGALVGLGVLAFAGDHDRNGDVIGPFAHHRLDAQRLQVFLGVRLHVQHDGRAGFLAGGGGEGEFAAAFTGPGPGFRRAGLARGDFHAVGNHERRIEADAELADQARAVLGLGVRQGFAERLGAGAGDGAEVGQHFVMRHADAVIGDGECARCLVGGDSHLGLFRRRQLGAGEGFETAAIRGVRGVGHQFAQEDFTLGIQRMHHQIEQAADLGAKIVFLNRRFAHGDPLGCATDMRSSPLEFNGITHSKQQSSCIPRRSNQT